MFAGDGASERDGEIEDLFHREFDSVHFLVIALVGQEGWMKVAVTHVTEGSDFEIVTLTGLLNEADHFRQLATGNRGILEDGRRRDASER